ncbi:unnamed protein product [Camellia sinensis]
MASSLIYNVMRTNLFTLETPCIVSSCLEIEKLGQVIECFLLVKSKLCYVFSLLVVIKAYLPKKQKKNVTDYLTKAMIWIN